MESSYLKNKRILFISTGFYDYDQCIMEEMIAQGGDVEYLCTTGSAITYRILSKFGINRLANRYHLQYLKSEIKGLRKNNDIIFIIKGSNLTEETINILFQNNPKASKILYFWDDVARISNIDLLKKNFANIYSFDTEDCRNYGFKFRPLFYRNISKVEKKKYYISSISGLHSDRLLLFRVTARILDSLGYKYKLQLVTSQFEYLKNRYIFRKYRKTDKIIITTHSYPFKTVEEIMSNSMCVLDSPHLSQKGLTIRTIEALNAGCHLFTTNSTIREYKDISEEYYTIIDKKNIDSNIFKSDYPLSKLTDRYSLSNFLFELLSSEVRKENMGCVS